MPAKKHFVALTPEQRDKVEIISRSNKHSERERKRARILLLADTARTDGACRDSDISEQARVSTVMVEQVRRRFAEGGMEAALFHKEQQNRKSRVIDGEAEAFLIASVCSDPPTGKAKWSLHLLKDKIVEAGYTDNVSRETVRQTLKKMNLNLG